MKLAFKIFRKKLKTLIESKFQKLKSDFDRGLDYVKTEIFNVTKVDIGQLRAMSVTNLEQCKGNVDRKWFIF